MSRSQETTLHESDPMSRSKRSEETTLRACTCQGVRDLKKQHYESHVIMSWSKRSEETTLRVTCE